MWDIERRVLRRMQELGKVRPAAEATERAMAAARQGLAREIRYRQIHQTRRFIMKFAMPTGIAAAVVVAIGLVFSMYPAKEASAAEVFRDAIAAISHLQTLHIKVNVRTIPRDNFHYIDLKLPMVTHEIWKEYGPPVKSRIEKPGRVIVVNDQELVALIRPNVAWKATGHRGGDIGWFRVLLEPDKALELERQAAADKGWVTTVSQRTAADGVREIVLAVEAKAEATYTNNYLKNSSIADSDTRRIYRFDAETKLLRGVQIFVHGETEDVLAVEVTEIEYNRPIEPAVFALELPENVRWVKEIEVLPDNAKYEAMTPKEMAETFFKACADEDWDEVSKFWQIPLDERFKEYMGGIEIVSIGEPFQSGRYPGWFVPYEIKLRGGHVKAWKLAVRCDNPAGRYVVDGGI